MKITLLRHGRPDFAPLVVGPDNPPLAALQAYAASRVKEPAPEHLLNLSATTTVCVTSQLQRTTDSAKQLGIERAVTSALLNEAELPCPDRLYFGVPWSLFLVLYRVLWFLGYQNNCPGRLADRKQAVLAAGYLQKHAAQHSSVLAIGHGLMNRMICAELRKSGWSIHHDVTPSSGAQNNSTGYWSAITLQSKDNTDS